MVSLQNRCLLDIVYLISYSLLKSDNFQIKALASKEEMDRVSRSYRRKSDTPERVYDRSRQLIEAADRKATALLLIDRVIISLSAIWNLRKRCVHVR